MKNKEDIQKLISFILIIAVFYGLLQVVGITCPIKYVTGVSCPGCGMTRAWLAALTFHFKTAFAYHPLWPLPALLLPLFFYRKRINKKLFTGIWIGVVALFLLVYIYRMICDNNHIVQFDPAHGLIGRLLFQLHIL